MFFEKPLVEYHTVKTVWLFIGATIASYIEVLEWFDGDFYRFMAYSGILPIVYNFNKIIHLRHLTNSALQELWTAFVK